MKELKVAYFQRDLTWEDKQQNFADIELELSKQSEPFDLLVLAEAFATGFTDNIVAVSEPAQGETFAWMKCISKQYDIAVVGSCFVEDEGCYYNRLYWVKPSGEWGYYDKRHLFRIGVESEVMTSGASKTMFELKGWRISPFVCYDLRFPIWMRNRCNAGVFDYDLALVVASWPAKRTNVWKQLLVARAIENMSYVVGVNRIGKDANDVSFSGDSRVVNYKGDIMDEILVGENRLSVVTLSREKLCAFREKMPFYLDWDKFELK
ncbi:MAG: nitrilase family protein [Bacteroidales bacterium]|nr:nitrilase family protein [Bacteroidales bacterium]